MAHQVGKTTIAFHILNSSNEKHPAYFNWDIPQNQRKLIQGELPGAQPLIILDEIHKYKKWRNLVKGFYDGNKSSKQFLITGSARLDYYCLHPFSLFEINRKAKISDLDVLLRYGGFPEPFFKSNERHWKRWQNERQERVIQEDLLSVENVKDITQLKLLANLLPPRVGSLLSIVNLKQDIGVAFETIDKWISIFENLYYFFRIQAYGFSVARAAKKEKKIYSPFRNTIRCTWEKSI